MGDSDGAGLQARHQDAASYRVELLAWPQVVEEGIAHGEGGGRRTLAWSRVLRAFAAEVGEPEGVRTIVFDLVVELKRAECLAYRFDVDPGPEARSMAIRIAERLGAERCARSLLDLAADGAPSRAFPDLEALAEDALEELGL